MPVPNGMSSVASSALPPIDFGFTPSPQQQAIFTFGSSGRGNGLIEAVAGSGKTTTLVALCQIMRGQLAFLAFNKAIAKEIEAKLLRKGIDWKKAKAGTFHSFGNSAWGKVAPRARLESKKLDNLCGMLGMPKIFWPFAKAAVSMAKQHIFGVRQSIDREDWEHLIEHYNLGEKIAFEEITATPEEVLTRAVEWSIRLLKASNEQGQEFIDFDDMIYLPLLFNTRFWQYDAVLGDEWQDTNPARMLMAERLMKPSGRLIAVGDRHQAIYGFTGAMSDAFDVTEQRFQTQEFALSVTYRCAQAIVRHAQRWVSHIEAAPDAPEGSVEEISEKDFRKLTFKPSDAILCRNTKPLVAFAFDLIRRGIGCHVEGRDIGAGLIALTKKWKGAKTIGELREKLEDHLQEETERLNSQGKEMQAEALQDRIDTLFVLMEQLADDDEIKALEPVINNLFQDSFGEKVSTVTLSTVHKAKGREWDTVYLLGRNRFMPSFWARQAWEKEQEKNLIYVAVTRAKTRLVEVKVEA